jgi:hypothetical protein
MMRAGTLAIASGCHEVMPGIRSHPENDGLIHIDRI